MSSANRCALTSFCIYPLSPPSVVSSYDFKQYRREVESEHLHLAPTWCRCFKCFSIPHDVGYGFGVYHVEVLSIPTFPWPLSLKASGFCSRAFSESIEMIVLFLSLSSFTCSTTFIVYIYHVYISKYIYHVSLEWSQLVTIGDLFMWFWISFASVLLRHFVSVLTRKSVCIFLSVVSFPGFDVTVILESQKGFGGLPLFYFMG